MHRLAGIVWSVIFFVSTPVLANVYVSLRSRPDVSLGELLPLSTWKKQFEITEGKDRGKIVPLTLQHDRETAGRWDLRFGDYAGILITNDLSRGLVIERLNLFKSRSYIVYEPALPILARDRMGENTLEHQANFKMFDVETGKLKRTGRVVHAVKQVSQSRFDTPAGLIDGYYIEIDHRMDMQWAQLHMTLGLGCRLDDGPVFGSGQYTLTKLGIFTEKKTAAAALTPASSDVTPRH